MIDALPGSCIETIAEWLVPPPDLPPWSVRTAADARLDAAALACASKTLSELADAVRRRVSGPPACTCTCTDIGIDNHRIDYVHAMRLCSSLGIASWPGEVSVAGDDVCRWKFLRACATDLGQVGGVGCLEAIRDVAMRDRGLIRSAATGSGGARVPGALTRLESELCHREATPACGRGCVDDTCVVCGLASCAGNRASPIKCQHASYERIQGRWTTTCSACASDPACYIRVGWPDATPGVVATCDTCFHFRDAAVGKIGAFVTRDTTINCDDGDLLRCVMRAGAPLRFPVDPLKTLSIDLRCGCVFAADIVSFRTNL